MATPGYGGNDETTITGKNGKSVPQNTAGRRRLPDNRPRNGTHPRHPGRPPRRLPRRRRHPPAGRTNPTPPHILPLAQEPDRRTAHERAKPPHSHVSQPRMVGRGNRAGRHLRPPRRCRNSGSPPLPVRNAIEAQSRRPPGRAEHPATRADRPGLPPLRPASRPVNGKLPPRPSLIRRVLSRTGSDTLPRSGPPPSAGAKRKS